MVLTKSELIGLLQHEVNVLQHLCTKIEPTMVDYRPTPKQRSTKELLQYLTVMGPGLTKAALTGTFDREAWGARAAAAANMTLDELVKELARHSDEYKQLLGDQPDEVFRREIEMFGNKSSVGSFLVSMVLGGCAAYRTQLFCYLKACGREELGTANLWRGVDPAPATV